MKTIFTFAFVFLLSTFSFSQQKVALHHNGTTTVFGGSNPFNDAYLASVSSDTIYLPGGNLPYPATINKSLTIIGAGHYPATTVATNRTVLNGNLTISENADDLLLEGIEITGTLSFTTNHKVDGVVVKRCRINTINYIGNATTPCLNNTIRECVINNYINFANAKSTLLTNCFIGSYVINGSELGISNNIFLYSGGAIIFNTLSNSSISNNIIFQLSMGYYFQNNCSLNTFSNNIITGITAPDSNTFVNNYNSIPIAGLFTNQTGNVFDYTHDYHLVSPTSYLGTDGSQVGIYGGLFPYKESALPINPNIVSKTIAPQTNANGELNIQIEVKAQTN